MKTETVEKEELKIPPPHKFFDESDLCGVESWDELKVFGKQNIQELIKKARFVESWGTQSLADIHRDRRLYEVALEWAKQNSSEVGGYFAEQAKQYDDPHYKPEDLHYEGKNAYPPGTDAHREKGSTTFNICGWCKYNGTGSAVGDCMLDTGCNLLQRYPTVTTLFKEKGLDPTRVHFNTHCLMHTLSIHEGETAFTDVQDALRKRLDRQRMVNSILYQLRSLRNRSGERPLTPLFRSHTYLVKEDAIIAFVPDADDTEQLLVTTGWIKAVCVEYVGDRDAFLLKPDLQIRASSRTWFHADDGATTPIPRSSPLIYSKKDFDTMVHLIQQLGPDATYQKLMTNPARNDEQAFLRLWFKQIKSQDKDLPKTLFEAFKNPVLATPKPKK